MQKAFAAAKQYPNLPVPIHLRNAPTRLMKNLGYGKDYKWQADYKHAKGFLPDELKDLDLFK
jgi:putative ATPase